MSGRTKRVFSRVAESVGLDKNILLPFFEGEEFFTLELSEGLSGEELIIEALFVPVDLHGEGWGRKIMAALEEAAFGEGYARISLRAIPYSIGKGTSAGQIRYLVSWYESLGYKVVSRGELDNLKEGTVYTHETGSVNMSKKIVPGQK
jgi:GNAT superfamily N-acetyltransferase